MKGELTDAAARKRLVEHARTDHLCAVARTLIEGRQRLIEFLQAQYVPTKATVQPQLAYELIAHLMKHRLVDHVVSLNFDEVLDVALHDELGEEGYQLVLPNSGWRPPRQGQPCLFKLHGTIGQPDSLRFETAETGMLSRRVIDLLDKAIFGPANPKSVRIVSLGYSWSDPDMVQWLVRHHADIAGLICVALDEVPCERVRRGMVEALGKKVGSAVDVLSVATERVVSDGRPATIDEVLWAVWNAAVRRPTSAKRVPSAARHLLISHLFPSRRPESRRWPHVYQAHGQASRFEAEVLLTTGKTDGLITLSSLARDVRVMRHWSARLGRGKTALDRMTFLKRGSTADVTDLYVYRGESEDYAKFFDQARGDTLFVSDQQVPDLREQRILVPSLIDGEIVRKGQSYLDFLSHYLRKVFDGPSIEVDPGQDPRGSLMFIKPEPLRTYKALRDRTASLIARSEWTTLLIIAESGYWLSEFTAQPSVLGGRQVLLIEASSFGVTDWRSRRPVILPDNVTKIGIPWWVHNRHLTLAMRADGTLSGGIYFRRRQRTSRISPVAISAQEDLRELLEMFLAYAARFLEEFGRWTDYEGGAAYDAKAFFKPLLALNVARSLGDGSRDWLQRLERAWAGCNLDPALSPLNTVRPQPA
jgi:hypothetical protein